jgi:dihydrolipoamide dehydrogenase
VVVGEMAESVQVVVVGGGPGGYAAALRVAERGRRVVLVERGEIGGTCLNVGCIPSKVLIHAADVAASGPAASRMGIDLTATVDMSRLRSHMDDVVHGLTSGVAHLLKAAGVEVVAGSAQLRSGSRLAVDTAHEVRYFDFEHCILATGSRPVDLPHLRVDGARVLDSEGALALDEVPATMAVVGGGYIGVELGTAYAKLGAAVTIVELEDRLLPLMEPLLGRAVRRRLDALGVRVLTGARAGELTGSGLAVSNGEGDEDVPADRVVVCVGRRPNTDGIGLEAAGATVDGAGRVVVGPDRRAADRLFAIGDITDGPALAHKATAEAAVAAAAACGEPASFDVLAIPQVVFSDPEVVSVGATLAEAKAALGDAARAFRFPFTAGARAKTLDRADGFCQVVADGDGTVVGVHLAGVGVSELAGEAALAVELGATVEDLAATVHPHPTMSEAIAEAAMGVAGTPLHVSR